MRTILAPPLALVLCAACGTSTNAAAPDAAAADARAVAPAADAGAEPVVDASPATDGPLLGLCSGDAVAHVPSPYVLLGPTFAADGAGLAFAIVPSELPASAPEAIGATSADGTFRIAASLGVNDHVVGVAIDSSWIYFTQHVAATAATGLYRVPRATAGNPTALFAGDSIHQVLSFAITPGAIYVAVSNEPDDTKTSIFALPTSGGPLGSPVYTAPDGTLVEDLSFDPGANALAWPEITPWASFRIVSAPAVAGALAPKTLAQSPQLTRYLEVGAVTSGSGLVFGLTPLPTPPILAPPVPPPPPTDAGGGAEGGALDAGVDLDPGIYTLGADGGVVLADPRGMWPGVADGTAAYYPTPDGISSLAFGSTTPATVTKVPVGPPYALAVGPGHRVYYTLSTEPGCIYRAPSM